MPTVESWQEIDDELSQLSKDQQYKQYKPLLDNLQHMVDAKYPSLEIVEGVLGVVKNMQAQGTPAQEVARQVEGGFNQPQWEVKGDVNQANRDLIKQTFVTIVNNNIKELKEEELDLSIPVPIVLLVMTRMEAEELVTSQAFKEFTDTIYTEQFNRYQEALKANNFGAWIQRYGDKPEQWQPFSDDPKTISAVVTQALASIEGYEHPLVPNFIDVRAFQDVREARRSLWNLRQNGCVVIIDSISIRHPVIQRAYRRTLLDAFPNTLLVKLNPFDNPSELEEQMIKFSDRYIDLEFFKRFRVDKDAKCDEVEDNFHFERWLLDQAPKLLPEEEKAKKGWRKHAFK